jgi:hypothetical protein
MFLIPRKFIVIVLTLLQFIAPLAHAHAHGQGDGQGLHIPGLEGFSTRHNTAKTLPCHAAIDGLLVVVDGGLKQQRASLTSNADNNVCLPQQASALNATAFRLDSISPQPQAFVATAFTPAHSPRAPPAP